MSSIERRCRGSVLHSRPIGKIVRFFRQRVIMMDLRMPYTCNSVLLTLLCSVWIVFLLMSYTSTWRSPQLGVIGGKKENGNLVVEAQKWSKPVNAEDARLQRYLTMRRQLKNGAGYHSQQTVAGVITILAYTPRVEKLKQLLQMLYQHFNNRFAYPVLLFHEGDFQPHIQDIMKLGVHGDLNMSSVFFQLVNLSVPDWQIRRFGQPPREVQPWYCNRGIGYRSMCRFHAKLIYLQPVMKYFDYQWRLDDDSVINADIAFDVFAALKNSGASYGYHQSNIDPCATNSYNMTVKYAQRFNITPTFFHRLKWNEVFFNNFEVSALRIWRSPWYRDFVDHVDSLGVFYTQRWGDAPVKTLALSLFLPFSEVYHFNNVSYGHKYADDMYFLPKRIGE